jgi:hypothetical protein
LSILTTENVVLCRRHEDEILLKENETTLANPDQEQEDCGPKHKVQLDAMNKEKNNNVQKSTIANTSSIVENGNETNNHTIEMEMEEMFNSQPNSDSHDQDNNSQQNQNETNQVSYRIISSIKNNILTMFNFCFS